MAKTPKKKDQKPEEIEIEPGAWERFDRAIDSAIKGGPKPKKGERKEETE